MLKRILSAVIAIPVGVILALQAGSNISYNIAVAVISGVIVYELLTAVKCESIVVPSAICIIFTTVMPILSYFDVGLLRYTFVGFCIFALFLYYIFNHEKIKYEQLFFMISSTMLVTCSMGCLVALSTIGDGTHVVMNVVLTLCMSWIADAGAYFVGTFLGKHKLCPKISPKKTVEGFFGGVLINGLLAMLLMFGYSKVIANFGVEVNVDYFLAFLIGLICAGLGTAGDLSASLLKRECKIKDFGNLMPGHGGMLDRFDSVLFVAPFAYIFLSYFNIYN